MIKARHFSPLKYLSIIFFGVFTAQCSATDRPAWEHIDAASLSCEESVPNAELPRLSRPNSDMTEYFQNDTESHAFMRKVQSHDYQAMQNMIDAGYNINSQDADGMTPIAIYVVTARPLCLDMYRTLLDMGADVTIPKSSTKTPLLFAIAGYQNNSSLLRIAIEKGANPNLHIKGNYYGTVLNIATTRRSVENAKLLFNQGADTSIKDSNGSDALTIALLHRSYTVADFLLAHGVNLNRSDRSYSASIWGVATDRYTISKRLKDVPSEKVAELDRVIKSLREKGHDIIGVDEYEAEKKRRVEEARKKFKKK